MVFGDVWDCEWERCVLERVVLVVVVFLFVIVVIASVQ